MPSASEVADQIRKDPVWFLNAFFGEGPVFDKQQEILESIRDFPETLVPSCHDSGKTWTAARALIWFLFAHPEDSIVLSTAPTYQQVVELLWREVQSAVSKAKFPLFGGKSGRLLQAKLELGPKWFATGITSDDPVNYQGFHASNILVILDEADGVKKEVWDALEGVLTSGNAKLLAIGNPLDPTSEFANRVRNAKQRSKVIRIAADDVLPHTDGGKNAYLLQRAWVEDKKEKWGETSALYLGKVLARWPDQNVDTLIPIPWLLRAKGRSVERGILTYGADIARFGSNRTVRTLIAGNQFLWSKATSKEDTMETATRIIGDLQAYEPAMVQIDETGIGGAVVDRVRQVLKDRYPIVGVNNGGKANNETKFANRGSEMYWYVRDAFERDQIGFSMDDPEAVDELIADLNRPTYAYNRRQQLIFDKFGLPRGTNEYGLTSEERAAKSPDRGDSFVLALTAAAPFIAQRKTTMTRSHSYLPQNPSGVRI